MGGIVGNRGVGRGVGLRVGGKGRNMVQERQCIGIRVQEGRSRCRGRGVG